MTEQEYQESVKNHHQVRFETCQKAAEIFSGDDYKERASEVAKLFGEIAENEVALHVLVLNYSSEKVQRLTRPMPDDTSSQSWKIR